MAETFFEDKLVFDALVELNKAIRAVSYYPAGHPSLNQVAEKTLKAFGPIFAKHEQLEVVTSRKGFQYNDRPLGHDNVALVGLAEELFRRRIKKLIILKAISPGEVQAFSGIMQLDPDDMQKRGGIEKLLAQRLIKNIWANEVNFGLLEREDNPLQMLMQMKQQEMGTDISPSEKKLLILAQRLPSVADVGSFVGYLEQASGLLNEVFYEGKLDTVYNVLETLGRYSSDASFGEEKSDILQKAIRSVINKEVMEMLLTQLATHADRLTGSIGLFKIVGRVSLKFIIGKLVMEETPAAVKLYAKAAASFEEDALPVLEPFLSDARPLAVKNALSAVGEIGSELSLPSLKKLISVADDAIRREAIVTVGKLRTPGAMKVLASLLDEIPESLAGMIIKNFEETGDENFLEVLEDIVNGNYPNLQSPATIRLALASMLKIKSDKKYKVVKKIIIGSHSKDHDPQTKLGIINALASVYDKAAVELLSEIAFNGDDRPMREAALNSLASINATFWSLQ